ncbi:unnamed protein product, partial [marine sediment metagenome]
MKTREQIDSEHNTNVQNIRASYHDRQEISHEEYHRQLNTENERYKAELAFYFPPEPPLSTHISVIDAIDTSKARPVRVKRVWEGRDYFYDCLV